MVGFIKKNLVNILFFGFVIFLFTPYGLPVRALFIRGVSIVTTRIFSIEIDKESQVRLKTYEWDLLNADGEMISFESLKDQVVVVNFWATWCPPCVAEMPAFQKLYDAYGDKVVFLFVANDQKERVNNFIKDKGYVLPVYFQASAVPQALSSNSLPTTYIIDRDGVIVTKKIGAADWNSGKIRTFLEKLLHKKRLSGG